MGQCKSSGDVPAPPMGPAPPSTFYNENGGGGAYHHQHQQHQQPHRTRAPRSLPSAYPARDVSATGRGGGPRGGSGSGGPAAGSIVEAGTIAAAASIRGGTLRVVQKGAPGSGAFSVEFLVDCACDGVQLHTYVACRESAGGHGVHFPPQEGVSSETHSQVAPRAVPRGVGSSFAFDVTVPPACVASDENRGTYPLVLSLQAKGGTEQKIAYITAASATAQPQARRAVLLTGGQMFLLKEVYGDADDADGASPECTICLTDEANTVVLPCRHKCVCDGCARSLQSSGTSKCPICRAAITYYLKRGDQEPPSGT
eukprot:Rhum_TRINITY_DN173_c0_g1::Rhum_TRINITY_DN173_c0_g1_i1::g.505::m.505